MVGTSRETSDFAVDCLELWWAANRERLAHIRQLVINLDNGPPLASNRTQFIRRMVEFVDLTGLEVVLAYYPPYHSKYNRVERCWGDLENHWNGALLDSIRTVLGWAGGMTWKGLTPTVHLLETVYEKGVRLSKKQVQPYAQRLERDPTLRKYAVRIRPLAQAG